MMTEFSFLGELFLLIGKDHLNDWCKASKVFFFFFGCCLVASLSYMQYFTVIDWCGGKKNNTLKNDWCKNNFHSEIAGKFHKELQRILLIQENFLLKCGHWGKKQSLLVS